MEQRSQKTQIDHAYYQRLVDLAESDDPESKVLAKHLADKLDSLDFCYGYYVAVYMHIGYSDTFVMILNLLRRIKAGKIDHVQVTYIHKRISKWITNAPRNFTQVYNLWDDWVSVVSPIILNNGTS